MFKVDSNIFVYHDELQRIGECYYDVVIHNDRWIVVFTELINNPGPSVTNTIEHIVSQFCKLYNLNINEVDFFERYQSHPNDLDVIYWVEDKPVWSRVSSFVSEPILKILKC